MREKPPEKPSGLRRKLVLVVILAICALVTIGICYYADQGRIPKASPELSPVAEKVETFQPSAPDSIKTVGGILVEMPSAKPIDQREREANDLGLTLAKIRPTSISVEK